MDIHSHDLAIFTPFECVLKLLFKNLLIITDGRLQFQSVTPTSHTEAQRTQRKGAEDKSGHTYVRLPDRTAPPVSDSVISAGCTSRIRYNQKISTYHHI